ncbi:MAG: hypothetical protein ABSH08_19055, partial [Tepidisphaeraceae bacterium]
MASNHPRRFSTSAKFAGIALFLSGGDLLLRIKPTNMGGRKIKAWVAFSVSLATIVLACLGGFWWTAGPWIFYSRETKYIPVAATPATVLVAPIVNDPNMTVFQSGNAADRQAVLDGIWRLAAQRPSVMADHLLNWYGPLMQQKQFADVEGLSLVAILKRAWWYPAIATCQEARVRALLAEGQYTKTLADAKSYYDIAPLADTPTAIELLGRALEKARGPNAAAEFRRQQQARMGIADIGACGSKGLLTSIKVDDSRLKQAIAITRVRSTFPFANQISQGNLLLLADRPAEAEQSFIKACDYVKQDWDLPQALEGIARAIRDQDCSLERASKFITLLQAADSIAPTRITLPTQLNKWVLRSAARQIKVSCSAARTQLPPPSGDEPDFVKLPPASSEAAFDLKANNLPITDPVLLSRLATQGD